MNPILILGMIIIFIVLPVITLILKFVFKNSIIFTVSLVWLFILATLAIMSFSVGHTQDIRYFFWALPFGLVIIVSGNFFLYNNIKKKLKKITDDIITVSTGNINISIDEKQKQRKDEIGEITKALSNLISSTKQLAKSADAIGQGNYKVPISVRSKEDILSLAIEQMKVNLLKMKKKTELQDWFKTGEAELSEKMQGDQSLNDLAQNVISYLSPYLGASVGAIYLKDEHEDAYKLISSYAYKKRKGLSNVFKTGEGLVGQAALEKQTIVISDVPDDYIKINSGLGESKPLNILVTPLIYDNVIVGVIELGSFKEFSDIQLKFIEEAGENIAIAIQSAQSRSRVKELLEETQNQAQELQSQQEELRVTNEELQAQQEELRVANEELEEQTKILRERQEEIENKNKDLEKARKEIENKAKELEKTSKYKSEFLANMSHELRTPLNSIQILSKLLADNKENNLTEKQITFAKTINSSGADLLELINEILDLSKIEAGKMVINFEKMSLKMLPAYVKQNFEHITSEKNIFLRVKIDENLPESIITDRQRVEQIIKNLLSNSIKFTSEGGITVSITRPDNQMISPYSRFTTDNSIAISVSDTGVGISKEKQELIFQAFQQADGTINRKYGGTGLGLSISKELTKLLGGEIFLSSEEGEGSTFTIVLPLDPEPTVKDDETFSISDTDDKGMEQADDRSKSPLDTQENDKENKSATQKTEIRDDRLNIEKEDKIILVIEDDKNFSKILFDFTREKGYKCIIAGDGEAGLQLANQFKPNAIILDIGLPRIDGWAVMERLKTDTQTKHIPVYFISGHDKKLEAMKMGAIGFQKKPLNLKDLENAFNKIDNTISKNLKNLLIIEDDKTMQESLVELVCRSDINIDIAESGKVALNSLKNNEYDCIILDLGLHDISGFNLIEKIKKDKDIPDIPIIVYTGRELTQKEENRLQKHAESIIIKGAKSSERLLDEVSLFLHRVKNTNQQDQKIPNKDRLKNIPNYSFTGKRILLADDDIRNIFALSSILEEKGIEIIVAENGIEAVNAVKENDDIDLVLMDVMMPEMDGFEAMKNIRTDKKNAKLPIIALTAKAMKGDREKCIQAGANDYLSKPIDIEKLFSMLHVWLYDTEK